MFVWAMAVESKLTEQRLFGVDAGVASVFLVRLFEGPITVVELKPFLTTIILKRMRDHYLLTPISITSNKVRKLFVGGDGRHLYASFLDAAARSSRPKTPRSFTTWMALGWQLILASRQTTLVATGWHVNAGNL